MNMFLMGIFVGLALLAVFALSQLGGDQHPSDWNDSCQYGNEYMMADGSVIKHSDCK